MTQERENWGDYSKLVLKELERLNDNYEKMRTDLDTRFGEINFKFSDLKAIERSVIEHKEWKEKVNDVWSPLQMKEAKDEIYKQKSRWVAAIAIITFTQILVGIAVAVWRTMH